MNVGSKLYCPVRGGWVAALPEEQVRQDLLAWMTEELGYPLAHIAVERSLDSLPYVALKGERVPDRRVDLICFARGIHPDHDLYPLLLVECKASLKATPKVLRQIEGYNRFVGAPFLAVVNDEKALMGWYDKKLGDYKFVEGLAQYDELIASVKLFM